MFQKKLTCKIDGELKDGFEAVKAAFEESFLNGDELSAQLCVVEKGEVVVDLWGSVDNPKYGGDTLQCVWSCSKNLTAFAMAILVDRLGP